MSAPVDVPGPDIQCSQCAVEVPTVIHCTITDDPDAPQDGRGHFLMQTTPDLSELWSHMWFTHGVKS